MEEFRDKADISLLAARQNSINHFKRSIAEAHPAFGKGGACLYVGVCLCVLFFNFIGRVERRISLLL